MTKRFSILAIALLFLAASIATAVHPLNDTNTTTVTPVLISYNGAGHEMSEMPNGDMAFYVVITDGGWIRPATVSERTAIDTAIEDGTIERFDIARHIARGVTG